MTTIEYDIKINDDSSLQSLGQLEAELESLNQQIKQVDVNSDAFKTLSNSIQGVTGKINEANSAIEGMTLDKKIMAADGAIKAFAGSISGAVGTLGLLGVESDTFGEFEKKATSAIALAMGLKDISEGYKQIKESTILAGEGAKAFSSTTRTALAATGIGLLVVALGTIVAYWDEIKEAISGVSAEQEELNRLTQENYDTSVEELDALKGQENVLRLQGKSEKEILQLKVQKLNKVIEIGVRQLQQAKNQLETDKAATERHRKIAEQVLYWGLNLGAAMTRLIALPIDAVIAAANKVAEVLGFQKIVSTDINSLISEGIEKASKFASTKIFNTDDLDSEFKEQEKALNALVDERAATQLKIKAINEAAAKEEQRIGKEQFDKRKQAFLESLKDEELSITQRRKMINDSVYLDAKEKENLLKELSKEEAKVLEEIRQGQIATQQQQRDEELRKVQEQYAKLLEEAAEFYGKESEQAIALKEAQRVKEQELKNKWKKEDEDKAAKDLEDKKTKELEDLEIKYEEDEVNFEQQRVVADERMRIQLQGVEAGSIEETRIRRENAEARNKIDEAEHNFKMARANEVAGALNTVGEIVGKQTAAGKALGIANALINTYVGVSEALKQKSVLPSPFDYAAKAINVAGVLATGFKAVRAITAVNVPGGGGGAGAPSVGSMGVPSAGSAPVSNREVPSIPVGTAPEAQQRLPIQTYVLAGNVSNGLQAQAQINSQRTIN